MKSRVHPTYKTKYRVKNWASYDRALVRRGDVTVWFSAAAIAAWEPAGVGRRGGQLRYSDLAIETALTIRLIFTLPLRQTEGPEESWACGTQTSSPTPSSGQWAPRWCSTSTSTRPQLQAHLVCPEPMARQPRPVGGLLAFLDPLLRRAALVVPWCTTRDLGQ